MEKRFHYLRKLEKRQKNSKRGHTDASLQVLENLQEAEEVPSSPGGHSTSGKPFFGLFNCSSRFCFNVFLYCLVLNLLGTTVDTRKTKQARLTKEQADALQVKYREWGGSLKNKSRHVHALANKLDLTVRLFLYLFKAV